MERWLLSSPEAKKEESRNSKAYGCYIAAVTLKIHMAVSVQLHSWVTLAVAGAGRAEGEVEQQ